MIKVSKAVYKFTDNEITLLCSALKNFYYAFNDLGGLSDVTSDVKKILKKFSHATPNTKIGISEEEIECILLISSLLLMSANQAGCNSLDSIEGLRKIVNKLQKEVL